jgi:hypothetical protein
MSARHETIASLRAIRPGPLAALLLATIGTNLLDFATVPAMGEKAGPGFVVAAFVRVVAVLWVSYSVQRHLAGGDRPFRPGLPLARFVALQIVLLVAMGIFTKGAAVMAGPAPDLAAQWLFGFLALALLSLLTIRLLAWNGALAMGEPFSALGAVWRGQAGKLGPIIGVLVGLILPVAAIHLALTLVAIKLPLPAEGRLALGVIDGLVQALQLGLSCALGAVAWKRSRAD